MVQPSAETASQVLEWLQDNGVEESQLQYSNAKDWIKVALPVAAVERLLDTKYSIYEHEDGTNLVRTPDWSLPKHLMEHVDTIQPTNSFFRPVPKRSTVLTVPIEDAGMDLELLPGVDKATVAEACNVTAVTPQCLRTLYGWYQVQIPNPKLTESRDRRIRPTISREEPDRPHQLPRRGKQPLRHPHLPRTFPSRSSSIQLHCENHRQRGRSTNAQQRKPDLRRQRPGREPRR